MSGKLFHLNATTGDLLQTYGNPVPNMIGSANFGTSVAVQGNNLLIGAKTSTVSGRIGAGAAYLFDATTGDVLQTFQPPTPIARQLFGSEVALAGDNVVIGTQKLSGEQASDGVYVYSAGTGALLHTLLERDEHFFPRVAADGNNILVGNRLFDGSTGVAYLFDATTGNRLQTFLSMSPNGRATSCCAMMARPGSISTSSPAAADWMSR